MELKKAIDAERYAREGTILPDPPKKGTVLSWDKQPKTLNDIYLGRRKRTFARVDGLTEEDRIRYARLSFLRPGDWQEFDTRTLQSRIASGEMEIHNPYELLALVADALADQGDEATAEGIRALLRQE